MARGLTAGSDDYNRGFRRIAFSLIALVVVPTALLLALSDRAFFGVPHLHGFKLGYAFLTPEEMERGLAVLAGELRRAMATHNTSVEPARLRA